MPFTAGQQLRHHRAASWRKSSANAWASSWWSKIASGAAEAIGSNEARTRRWPDGYTIGLANTSTHAVAASLAPLPYDPVEGFRRSRDAGHSPFVLALYPGVPAQTVQELIALARAKPRMLNYASAGPATLAHLAGALFEKMADIELTHVPYRGTAQSTLDLVEGRVEMQFGTIPPALTHIRAAEGAGLGGDQRGTQIRLCPRCRQSPNRGCKATNVRCGRRSSRRPLHRPRIITRLNREMALFSTILSCAPGSRKTA